MKDGNDVVLINPLYKKIDVKKSIWPVPVFGSIVLIAYTFLPIISRFFIPFIENWFLIAIQEPDQSAKIGYDFDQLLKLGISTFVIVGFIYMFLHYLFLAFINRLKNNAELGDNHAFEYRKINFRNKQAFIAFTLSAAFFSSTLWINSLEGDSGEIGILPIGLIIFSLAFSGIIALIVFSSLETIVLELRNMTAFSKKVGVWTKNYFLKIYRINISNNANHGIVDEIFPDYVDLEIENNETDYRFCVGISALCTSIGTIALMITTRPSTVFHDGFPVIFYITLLLFVIITLVFYWNSILRISALFAIFFYRNLKKKTIETLVAIAFLFLITLFFLNYLSNKPDTSSNENKQETQKNFHTPKNEQPVVLVALSGGGIAASAWSYEVLNYLRNDQPNIYKNIAAISSVSGGSLGAYYHLAESHSNTDKKNTINRIFYKENAMASRSSLGSVAWGAAAYDSWNIPLSIIPGYKEINGREDALIKRWSTIHCDYFKSNKDKTEICEKYKTSLSATFKSWPEHNSKLPHLLINSTSESTGERVVFSTNSEFGNSEYDFSNDTMAIDSALIHRRDECINNYKVVEAVYNSATFPFVGGAKKPDLSKIHHGNNKKSPDYLDSKKRCKNLSSTFLVDGGYNDNSGIQTIADYIAFLEKKGLVNKSSNIIVVGVDAYPVLDSSLKAKRNRGNAITPEITNELLSPIRGLLKSRTIQVPMRMRTIDDLDKNYNNFTFIPINYTGDLLTLSWHLSDLEKSRIREQIEYIGDTHTDIPASNSTDETQQYTNPVSDLIFAFGKQLTPSLTEREPDKVTQLEADVRTLKTSLSKKSEETTTAIGEVRAEVKRIHTNINSLVTSQKARFDNVDSKIKDLEMREPTVAPPLKVGQIDLLETRLERFNESFSESTTQTRTSIESISENVEHLKTNISSLAAEQDTTHNRLDNVDTKIRNLGISKLPVARLKPGKIEQLEIRLDSFDESISEKNAQTSTSIESINENIENLKTSFNSLVEVQDRTFGKFNTVHSEIRNLSNAITKTTVDWKGLVIPSVCEYGSSPEIIASTPIFNNNRPRTNKNTETQEAAKLNVLESDLWLTSSKCSLDCEIDKIHSDLMKASDLLKDNQTVHVIGTSSTVGNKLHNRRLSEKRAELLKHAIYLSASEDINIDTDNIRLHAFGEVRLDDSIGSSISTVSNISYSRRAFALVCNNAQPLQSTY